MNDFESRLHELTRQIELEIQEGRLNFPTAFDVTIRVKKLADNPDSTMEEMAKVVMSEPVLSAKVVRMANAVLLNPLGIKVSNVKDALVRIGLTTLRCLAFAVAAEQLAHDKRSPRMRMIASGLWMHTLDVACWAHALAQHTGHAKPDTAFFAAMMRNIGQFFLLGRSGKLEDVDNHLDSFGQFVNRFHRSVRRALVDSFELPEEIEAAMNDDHPEQPGVPPRTLAELLALAEHASALPNPFDRLSNRSGAQPPARQPGASLRSPVEKPPQADPLAELLETARPHQIELLSTLGN